MWVFPVYKKKNGKVQDKRYRDIYKMFYTEKTSKRNGLGAILDWPMKTKFVDMIRKSEWIIAVKLVIETGLAIIVSV